MRGDYQALINRLRKNQAKLRRWLLREGIAAYRLYDRDIPEFPLALDRYNDKILLQEYAVGWQLSPAAYQEWLQAVITAVSTATAVPPGDIYYRQRQRQKGYSQYQKQLNPGQDMVVHEGGRQFWVNLSRYLDSGLFLDHRPTRVYVGKEAAGLKFLNLFCYTASFTVYAATGGSIYSESVDLSNTYLKWARKNFLLNAIDPDRHRLIRAEAGAYLQSALKAGRQFDLIVLDPPTFSNSKKMPGVLDIQTDHETLITAAMKLLTPGGKLIFSTNSRRFRLSPSLAERYRVVPKSYFSVPPDYRDKKIHQSWWFTNLDT